MSLVPGKVAPPWRVSGWLNAAVPPTLASLRGRVVLVHAFQMLCPGCVQHGLPQLLRVKAAFDPLELVVIGLHSVFEHHAAMGRVALEAFVHEYRLGFPIGIDEPSADGPLPATMRTWGLRGTPSLVLLDGEGVVRLHEFGGMPDLRLGAAIASALQSAAPVADRSARREGIEGEACDADACRIA